MLTIPALLLTIPLGETKAALNEADAMDVTARTNKVVEKRYIMMMDNLVNQYEILDIIILWTHRMRRVCTLAGFMT